MIWNTTRYVLFASLVGGIVGVFASFFEFAFSYIYYEVFVQLTHRERLFNFILPILGSILSGYIIYRFSRLSSGGGVDVFIDAFHNRNAKLPPSLAIFKSITTLLTVPLGGSGGKEGPMTLIGATIGSYVSSLLKLEDRERRLFLLMGAASGASASFRLPVGGAFFAVEVLYRKADLEVESLGYVLIASVVAYAFVGIFHGWHPVFSYTSLDYSLYQIPLFILLGFVCSLSAKLFVRTNEYVERMFKAMELHPYALIVLGGFLTGIITYILPAVAGNSYDFVQSMLFYNVPIHILVSFLILKTLATAFTLRSGNSAGYFAPSVVLGATIGNLFAHVVSWFSPNVSHQTFTFLGIVGFFSAISNAPMASVFMALELTGGYKLLVPALIVSFISYFLSENVSIFSYQVESRLDSPAHRYEIKYDVLEHFKVKEFPLTKQIIYLDYSMPLEKALKRIRGSDQTTFPVLHKGKLVGFVFEEDIKDALVEGALHDMGKGLIVGDVSRAIVPKIYVEDDLHKALRMLVRYGYEQLPVYDGDTFVGLIGRKDILKAYDKLTK